MRAALFLIFRLAVLTLQMAGVLAFFSHHLAWSLFASVLCAVLLVAFLPLVATVLGFIGAVKVWLWPWWLALLVFLPGLALSLAALLGLGTAGAALILRRRLRGGAAAPGAGWRRPGWQGGQPAGQSDPEAPGPGDTIEGEVLSSRVDKDARD